MTIKHILRPSLNRTDHASLTLALAISAMVSGSAVSQTIGNARPLLPLTSVPASVGPADPADMLSMHLRTLAIAPRSLSALLGAGQSALAIGDANAALGFYARAEQVDARSGLAKAGLASALVMLERADDALPLFAQAVSLGMPEADLAGDRGLAYDLRGDSRRAQRDYALALKRRPDDETTRRYALSLGISGDRAEALKMLDPLLRKQDQSAWRARAFILAMTGDVPGANGIARQVMPANLASTMSPFLARLPQLNAADKAHAVDFGTMPAAGTNMASVEIGDPFHAIGAGGSASVSPSASDGLIPAGRPLGTRVAQANDVPADRALTSIAREPRPRRAMRMTPSTPTVLAQAAPKDIMPTPGFSTVTPQVLKQPERMVSNQGAFNPFGVPAAHAAPVVVAPVPAPVPSVAAATTPAFETTPKSVIATPVIEPVDKPAFETAPRPSQAAPTGQLTNTPAFETAPPPVRTALIGPPVTGGSPTPAPNRSPTTALVVPPMSRLASILAGLTPEMESAAVKLPTAAEAKAARRLAQRKAAEDAAVAADLKAEKEARAAELAELKRNPARLWVQVATGNNERGLPTTWSRIRDDNEVALKGRSAWSVPFKATNRLLVGPMKTPTEARALVNALAKNGVSANSFSSEAGQEVFRVGGK
jgi:Flp pilus assembly protein TadD